MGGGSPTLPAAPLPTPPVTTTNAEVVQAQNDLRRQALIKKGYAATIYAGDTGGYSPKALTPSPANTAMATKPGTSAKLGQ